MSSGWIKVGDRYDSEIMMLYDAGWSGNYIARRLNISPDTVHRRLRHNNVKIRKKGSYNTTRLSHAEFERAIFLHHTCKLSLRQTAELMDRSYTTIYRRLVYAGAPPRNKKESMKLTRKAQSC